METRRRLSNDLLLLQGKRQKQKSYPLPSSGLPTPTLTRDRELSSPFFRAIPKKVWEFVVLPKPRFSGLCILWDWVELFLDRMGALVASATALCNSSA